MFPWVDLALKPIEKDQIITTAKIRRLVRELPSGLNDIYDHMLAGINSP